MTARFVTGVAAAFMTPAGLSLITGNFPEGPQRTKALGVYAGTASGGYVLGLVAGGLLASVGWRWVFFAPVILAAVILVAALVLLKESEAPERPPGGFDLAQRVQHHRRDAAPGVRRGPA
ncbi:MFS transporter [Nonomuraea ferruginea]